VDTDSVVVCHVESPDGGTVARGFSTDNDIFWSSFRLRIFTTACGACSGAGEGGSVVAKCDVWHSGFDLPYPDAGAADAVCGPLEDGQGGKLADTFYTVAKRQEDLTVGISDFDARVPIAAIADCARCCVGGADSSLDGHEADHVAGSWQDDRAAGGSYKASREPAPPPRESRRRWMRRQPHLHRNVHRGVNELVSCFCRGQSVSCCPVRTGWCAIEHCIVHVCPLSRLSLLDVI